MQHTINAGWFDASTPMLQFIRLACLSDTGSGERVVSFAGICSLDETKWKHIMAKLLDVFYRVNTVPSAISIVWNR